MFAGVVSLLSLRIAVSPNSAMNSELELPWEIIKSLADDVMFKTTGRYLKDIEIAVLQGSWQEKGYEEIAESLNRSATYITRDIGSNLWKRLSDGLEEPVSKTNFKAPLKRMWEKQSLELSPPPSLDLKIPGDAVDLACPFYIERPPLETDCYRVVLRPGSLIRIRSPRRMGKTSLFNRILAYASTNGCKTARINLRQAEKLKFASLDTFLRWFCTNVSRQVNQEPRLDAYWDEESGSMISCTLYFQEYLLEVLDQTDVNLVVGLDEIDWIFHYPEIATEFLPLLRSWHDEANVQPIWKRLRLVMAHSTEIYLSLNVNQSPFNVGLPIKLPEFNQQQVQKLAQLHELSWLHSEVVEKLMSLIGGHPYLVRLALYNFARQSVTLEQFLQESPTHAGIYSEHLRGHLGHLEQHPDLVDALKQVVMADSPILLEWRCVYQLESMGLIKLEGNKVKPSCKLYRQYFSNQLS